MYVAVLRVGLKMFLLCPCMWPSPQEDHSSTAMEIVEAKDLGQLTDLDEIEALCRGIVQDPQHAKQVCPMPRVQ